MFLLSSVFYGQNYTSDHARMKEKSCSHAINNLVFRRSVTLTANTQHQEKVWWQTWEHFLSHLLQPNHCKNIQRTTKGDQHPKSLHFNVQCSASCNLALVSQKYRHKSHSNLQKRPRAPSHSKLNASECSQQLWNIF